MLAGAGALAWGEDEHVLAEVNLLHRRIFEPRPGEELHLDAIFELLHKSSHLFEDEIEDNEVGEKQNDLGWLRTLDANPTNCSPESQGMFELSMDSLPKAAHVESLIGELAARQVALCLTIIEEKLRELDSQSPSELAIAIADLARLVQLTKEQIQLQHPTEHMVMLLDDLSGQREAVAKALIAHLEEHTHADLTKGLAEPIDEHLRFVKQLNDQFLMPSCRLVNGQFEELYSYFKRVLHTHQRNIIPVGLLDKINPKLLTLFESLNLCHKISRARAENLFMVAKYDNPDLLKEAILHNPTQSPEQRADLMITFERLLWARNRIFDERVPLLELEAMKRELAAGRPGASMAGRAQAVAV